MDRSRVQDWLDRYVDAWRTSDRSQIEGLFSEEATYRWRPYGAQRQLHGRRAISDWWLDEPDAPGSWEARYEAWAIDGDRAVAVGWSRYLAGSTHGEQTYHNVYLLEFDPDGRCSAFTEYWMLEEPDA